jgi:hypothetical protein
MAAVIASTGSSSFVDTVPDGKKKKGTNFDNI